MGTPGPAVRWESAFGDNRCVAVDYKGIVLLDAERVDAFADDGAWTRARSAALAENSDGFRAYVKVVDDRALDGATWDQLREAVAGGQHAAVLFVVDRPALADEHPILVVDLSAEARRPFRCVAQELWSVDNNLNLANMDWEEFAGQTDAGGVFRGVE